MNNYRILEIETQDMIELDGEEFRTGFSENGKDKLLSGHTVKVSDCDGGTISYKLVSIGE